MRTLLFSSVAFTCFAGSAYAQCSGAPGVPYNCMPITVPLGPTDIFFSGHNGNTAKITGLQTAQGVIAMVPLIAPQGSVSYLNNSGNFTSPSGNGTVSSVTGGTANGVTVNVTSPTTTPVISVTFPFTGIAKSNGSVLSTAQAGVDYLAINGSGAGLTGLTWSQLSGTPTTMNGYGIGTADVSSNVYVATNGFTSRSASAYVSDSYNPRNYSAIGDGNTHAIGTALGVSLSAIAAYSPKLAWMTNTAYGLTYTLTTVGAVSGNNLTFTTTAAGRTIAAFNGNPSAGQDILSVGMTATAACLAAGATVAAIATSSGTLPSTYGIPTGVVTFSGTAPTCAAGSVITFALSNTQVQALTYDYLGIQSAVAAANANTYGGTVQVPEGQYVVNRPIINPGIVAGTSPSVDVVGAGTYNTRLIFSSDLGYGVCALGDGNRGPGSIGQAHYRDFFLYGPGTANTIGTPVAGMDGLCIGAKAHVDNVASWLFHAGFNVLEDHWLITNSDGRNNFFGVYWAPNGDTFGNGRIDNTFTVGEAWAGWSVAYNNSIAASYFKDDDTGGDSPYAIYGETIPAAIGGNRPEAFITASVFEGVDGEQNGDGGVYGENSSDTINYNLFMGSQPFSSIDNSGNFSITAANNGGVARPIKAVIYAGNFQNNQLVNWDVSNGSLNSPKLANAIFEVQNGFSGNSLGFQDLMVNNTQSVPMVLSDGGNGQVVNNTFASGTVTGVFFPIENAITLGQLIADGSVFYYGAKLNVNGTVPIGVALAAGAQYSVVPVATGGIATVAKVVGALSQGQRVCANTSTPASIGACSSGAYSVGAIAQAAPSSGATSTIINVNFAQTAPATGTFTCSSGTSTVPQTAIDSNSNVTLTLGTVGGTVAAAFVSSITPGTGFVVNCGTSANTSTYNYQVNG